MFRRNMTLKRQNTLRFDETQNVSTKQDATTSKPAIFRRNMTLKRQTNPGFDEMEHCDLET